MNHLKLDFLPKTIRGRVMAATAAATIAITLLTITICYLVFQSFLTKNQVQSAEYNLRTVTGNVSEDMKNIIYFSKWCCSAPDILSYLKSYNELENRYTPPSDTHLWPIAVSTFTRLTEEFKNTKSSKFIERVIISGRNREHYLQLVSVNSAGNYRSADIAYDTAFFNQLLRAPDYRWIGLVDDPFSRISPLPVIPIVRPVYNNYNTEEIGWTYMEISSQLFTNYLKTYPLASDSILYLTIGLKTYRMEDGIFTEIINPDYSVISPILDTAMAPSTTAYTVSLQDGSRRIMVSCPFDIDGFQISQILSKQQLSGQRQLYFLLIGAFSLVILTLGFLLAMFLNRSIVYPVVRVRGKMDQIASGDFTRDPSIEWPHEIGDIGRGINRLSEDILSLMEKKVSDEKQKKDLQYQILQSQINPHFLYNTLNSIKWMATIQNATGIAEMTTALARLLKNVSKGSSGLIPLTEELDLVKDYFLIQKYRYGGSITMEYEIESQELYSCLLHRFTLQPIIENALFHGIEPKGAAGKIKLTVKTQTLGLKKELIISVTDNGVGMTEETIRRVLEGDRSQTADFFKQVGIHNVNQRIKYDFGPSYGITIESQPGEYTAMHILIPFLVNAPENGAYSHD